MNRNQEIIKASWVGIVGNLLLSAFKFVVGAIANSVSITMDALNNLTDILSSVITIVGTRLSEKEPDRKHPFGYGRIEYLTSLFIGILILYAGLEAVRESVERIIHPEPNNYSTEVIIVVAAGILAKVLMGLHAKHKGAELDSAALIASGKDDLDDSIASSATLIAAIVYVAAGVRIEAYVGLVISGLIIKTGVETLRETVSSLLGERVEEEKAAAVKKCILSFPEVDGVFDLVIHNYGKERLIGSAHIEVPDSLRSSWIDNLQRAITRKVMKETGVEMLGITIYAENSKDTEAVRMREEISELVSSYEDVIGMHGFYLDKVDKEIKFDVVTDFDVKETENLRHEIKSEVSEKYPEYTIRVVVKKDFAD